MTRDEFKELLPTLDENMLRDLLIECEISSDGGMSEEDIKQLDRAGLESAVNNLYDDGALATLGAEDFEEGFSI